MAGHMGDKIRTMQNLEIIKTDLENQFIIFKRINTRIKKCEVLLKSQLKT